MPRKAKGEKIELLYNNKNNNKPVSKSKKSKKTSKANNVKRDNIINLDNEIIIGLTPKKTDNKKKNKNENKKTSHPRTNEKTSNKKQKKKSNTKKIKKKTTLKKKLIKWTILIILLSIAIILFILSDVFNIKQITVENNNKVSSEEIIKLSGLAVNENMFKTSKNRIRELIKTNAYIENVEINKNLNGTINLYVEERVTSYMLQYENYYAYMNNQGYILEVSDVKLDVPMIVGYKTLQENIQPGNRLNNEDLETLGVIIKIMQLAQGKELDEKITYIDITSQKNFIIKMENDGKTIHFGDSTNINEKLLWVVKLLELKKDVKGEMFLQDVKKVYFRDEV